MNSNFDSNLTQTFKFKLEFRFLPNRRKMRMPNDGHRRMNSCLKMISFWHNFWLNFPIKIFDFHHNDSWASYSYAIRVDSLLVSDVLVTYGIIAHRLVTLATNRLERFIIGLRPLWFRALHQSTKFAVPNKISRRLWRGSESVSL